MITFTYCTAKLWLALTDPPLELELVPWLCPLVLPALPLLGPPGEAHATLPAGDAPVALVVLPPPLYE